MVVSNAEVLSGVVIAELRKPGAPVVGGCGSGPLHKLTMVSTYTAPASMLNCTGLAQMAHQYGQVPLWGFSSCSDSRIADTPARIENAIWVLWTADSSANLVHDVRCIESGLTCSYEMIALGDELVSFVRRLERGGNSAQDEQLWK